MAEDKIYASMVIRSQAEAIELLEKEIATIDAEKLQLKKENMQLKENLKAVNKGLRKTQERRNKYKRKYLKEKWIRKQLKKWLIDNKNTIYFGGDILDKMQEIEDDSNE